MALFDLRIKGSKKEGGPAWILIYNTELYFRKVCMNCRCGKAEHNVIEVSDPGFYFIGRLFDRY